MTDQNTSFAAIVIFAMTCTVTKSCGFRGMTGYMNDCLAKDTNIAINCAAGECKDSCKILPAQVRLKWKFCSW